MSKDVANLIWQLAKNDKTLEGLALMEMFHKKVCLDVEKIRVQLKGYIAEKIKTTLQPLHSTLMLSDINNGAKKNQILGGLAMIQQLKGPIESSFCYTTIAGNVYLITNDETKFLIESIIPCLDLKWSIKDPGFENNIVVSWKHWNDV